MKNFFSRIRGKLVLSAIAALALAVFLAGSPVSASGTPKFPDTAAGPVFSGLSEGSSPFIQAKQPIHRPGKPKPKPKPKRHQKSPEAICREKVNKLHGSKSHRQEIYQKCVREERRDRH
jgi:hypothetical protein